MLINNVYYKETNSVLEIFIQKFFFKRKVYKVGNLIFVEFI